MVVTKQIYFSPIFLKSWSHISDNIAGVLGLVGGPQYYEKGYWYREGEGDLLSFFSLKDLLGSEKA